jgi:hypothetical protein
MTDTGRTPLNGAVDFTMMYVAHDAFTRDLQRMTAACQRGEAFTPGVQAGWAMFTKQLHTHHRTEDTSLWPKLRAVAMQPGEVRVLDAMELEHAQIDPQLERIDQAIASHSGAGLADDVRALSAGLREHIRHEEDDALPLVDTYLGVKGWAAFGRDIRKENGIRGGAEYLPWLLEDAPDSTRTKVLGLLPPPVRLLYRGVWSPRYHRAHRWSIA